MGNTGRIRRVFPGSNSAFGFYSFFDQIIGPEARRIFMLKGGPGVGKSTFMKNIGQYIEKLSFDVEYLHCASDSPSLDGLVIPDLGVAFMDGTAPHIVDPKYPGAVDEIIHLNFWDEAAIIINKAKIIGLSAEISRLFAHAYRFLSIAKVFLEALKSYASLNGLKDTNSLNRLALELSEEILAGKSALKGPGKVRRLFASAISPQGTVHYLDTLTSYITKIYILRDDEGSGSSEIIKYIMDKALMHGFYVEAFHCALDPYKVDHIIIPELDTAVINSVEPHLYKHNQACREIDIAEFFLELPLALEREKDDFRRRYRSALHKATDFLAQAKTVHDELENYYIPNMHFAEIERIGCEIMERLLNYSREVQVNTQQGILSKYWEEVRNM